MLIDAGIEPEVIVSGVDEGIDEPDTAQAVRELAERKAQAVATGCGDALVLGCDSMLEVDGRGVSKPASLVEAHEGWIRIAGREAALCTGHCLIDVAARRQTSAVARTLIRFGSPTEEEMAAYLATGEPLAAAGGFTIEGFGAPFVDGIDGDPSNVLGLSMPLLRRLLGELGVGIIDLWRRDGEH